MGIPVISENLFNSLVNSIETGFHHEKRGQAGRVISKGLHAMDMLTSKHRTAPEYCRAEMTSYIHTVTDENLKSSLNAAEKAMQTFFKVCSVIARIVLIISILVLIPFMVFAIQHQGDFNSFLDSWSDGNGHTVFYTLIGALLASIFLMVTHSIIRAMLKKRHRTKVECETENMIKLVTYSDLLDYAVSNDWIVKDAGCIKSYCNLLCERLNLDPSEFDIVFGKATGGGSTWVGWGSGAAIGGGLALSAISKLSANDKNAAINKRIEQLEAMAFYNNVAIYFNNNIMPKLLSSQPKFMNEMPIELVK